MTENQNNEGGFFNTPFFTFSKPYLDFIGQGRHYSIIYIVMAAASLIFPFAVLVIAVRYGIFRTEANWIIGFILTWFVIMFAGWIGAQIWWNRKSKIKTIKDSEFIAIPMVSDIVQTFGEWLGTIFAITGVGGGILLAVFGAGGILQWYGIKFPVILLAVIGPAGGLIYIILFRLIAEFIRVIAAFANNTKEIAANIKNK